MKFNTGTRIFNTDRCTVHKNTVKVTEDILNPRVTLHKEEVLCSQKQDSKGYFNWVKVVKYIDGIPVKNYSWIQDVDEEELKEFIERELHPRDPTPEDSKAERRRLLHRKYYLEHKEKLLEQRKQYYKEHKK